MHGREIERETLCLGLLRGRVHRLIPGFRTSGRESLVVAAEEGLCPVLYAAMRTGGRPAVDLVRGAAAEEASLLG